jgi:Secretion system C-terminal sorting domain
MNCALSKVEIHFKLYLGTMGLTSEDAMKWSGIVLLVVLMAASSSFSQVVPPINLSAELLQGGNVALSWDPPPDGLVEDFEDGIADGFDYYPDNIWTVEDGYLKCASWNSWKSSWHTSQEFEDFTLEGELVNQVSTNTRGLLFRADGPQAAGGNGYTFYVAYNLVNFSVYKYTNGNLTILHNWTPSEFINTGVGESNRLKVVGSGSEFDFYINDNYVSSYTDATYPSGMVGAVASSIVECWYDEITCLHGAIPVPADEVIHATPGIACDEFGVPLTGVELADQPRERLSVPARNQTDELDEFIEYRIYRDGDQVGTSTTESFMDDLPGLGDFEYTVTAFYDEGESGHAGPVIVSWDAVILDLVGQITTIPAEGGIMYYDATVINTLQRRFNNVDYWTAVTMPNGQHFEPLSRQRITIPGFLNVTVQALSLDVPFDALAGTYTFFGHLGYYPVSQLSDSFTFEKLGAVTNLQPSDPTTWSSHSSFEIADDISGDLIGVPSTFALSEAYPNPFNPSASFSVSLPKAAELTVDVYNIHGQLVTSLADGAFNAGKHEFTFDASGLASGLYFVHARISDENQMVRKMTLIR